VSHPQARCPHCREEATKIRAFFFQHGIIYCTYCGWNVGKAATSLRTDMWAMRVAAGLGVLLVGGALRGSGNILDLLLLGFVFIALPFGLSLHTWYRLSKVSVRRPHMDEHVVRGPSGSPTQADTCESSDVSLATRPRAVRLSIRGYFYNSGMGLITIFVLWCLSLGMRGISGSSSANSAKGVVSFLVWSLLLWSCVSFFRNRIRERRLFTNGELSPGIVLSQSNTRVGSRIVYSYHDASGNGFQNRATDFSNTLYEEMSIHVFYDSFDSHKSAVLEGSLYRIL
jgi:hypothetical protein